MSLTRRRDCLHGCPRCLTQHRGVFDHCDACRAAIATQASEEAAAIVEESSREHSAPVIAWAPGHEERLSDTGAIVVTARALDDYLEQTRGSADARDRETARRELTELLLDAHRIGPADLLPDLPERWRVRNRTVDVTCQVARSGRLALVTSLGKMHTRGPNA